MKDRIMLGLWKYLLSVPPFLIDMRKQVEREKSRYEAAMGFMSQEHRLVHHFVVRELPRAGKPLSPEFITEKTGLPRERIAVILNDLEEHMTFLFRNKQGDVAWAYPVTADTTPHYLAFSTGERIYAA